MDKVTALLSALFLILAAPSAFADKFNTEASSSTRGLGMGDAVLNTERGGYSVFYNPANIAAKDTGVNFQLVNVQFEGSDGLLSQIGHGSFGFQSLSDLYPDLVKSPNTNVNGRYSVYPNVTFRNFSVGMLYEVNQGAQVRASGPSVASQGPDRFAPTGAVSFRLLSGILRLGASVSYLTEGNANAVKLPPINASSLDYKSFIDSGAGLQTTGGVTLTLPFRYLPSFSLVARNIGNTKLTGKSLIDFGDGGIADPEPMMFDFATSLTIYLSHRVELKIEGDYRDVTNRLQGNTMRHIFAGGELIFFDTVKLRTGLMHGYPTFGFGVNTKKASLELAIYTEELDDRFRGTGDTRYVIQYTYSLFK